MDPVILGVFIFYMCVVLVIGFAAARRARGAEGFFLADRGLGAWVVGISAAASSESSWLLMGCVGMGFTEGLSALWIAVGCLAGFCLNWFAVAERLRKRSREVDAITVPDFLEAQVGDTIGLVRGAAILIILLLMFTYVAAQLTAMGKAFDAMFGIPYAWGVILGAAITIIYTSAGGFRAVSWTDVLQGAMMVAALLLLPIFLIGMMGGPGQLWDRLSEQEADAVFDFRVRWPGGSETVRAIGAPLIIDPASDPPFSVPELPAEFDTTAIVVLGADRDAVGEKPFCRLEGGRELTIRLQRRGQTVPAPVVGEQRVEAGELVFVEDTTVIFLGVPHLKTGAELTSITGRRASLAFLGFLIGMLGIGLGYPGTPHVITRFMAARGPREIAQGRAIAIAWGAISLPGAIFLGMTVRCLIPELTDPDYGILAVSERYLPPILAGLVLAAVVSAARSTVDSQLLVATSAVAHDTYHKLFRRELDERRMLLLSRVVVIALGLAAIGLALTEARAIFWFVLFSWAGLGASFGPVILLSLYWPGLTRWGALAGMLTGFITVLIWKLWLRAVVERATGVDVYELVPAFLLAGGVAILISLLTDAGPSPDTDSPGGETA